ncbi:FGGY-family carbohydrate kinase [Aliiruegeria sabulilitoris]|uniref:FGGY-family carbohydrate kinase n=1 Tax=Aliiruegeria sabulilitoris TaxID=1510458 RepID=UPI0008339FB1|nr:FGGY-family carbohydrate kinase [Aliiruegeria sabulilitoris]NDR55866.1 carbohydrate kinase [Pseudoruegeria sp. M32A2M]
MTEYRHVAVIDIGKTNAKVALVDMDALAEIDVRTTPNTVLDTPPYPHFDIDHLWAFILEGLAVFQKSYGIDAISVTTHGASVVLLDAAGGLAAPVLDYEHDGPDTLAAEYDAIRPDFEDTGAPRLPMGLNVGAQLHWLLRTVPGLRGRVAKVVTYPQFWVARLTGVACTEVTSLGCHTDLWEPELGRFSDLPARLGIADKMAPAYLATDRVGPVLPMLAQALGLAPGTPVFCGIHDSNASLYPHLLALKSPFTVLSTGTWVIAMEIGGQAGRLDPARDTLINVNALGKPVPSARFMGGREYEMLMRGENIAPTTDDIETVLSRGAMLLPSVVPESGPFQGRRPEWTIPEASLAQGQRAAVVSLYLAMMAETCLRMIGAAGPTLTEGPFARNQFFLDMLAEATGRPVLLSCGSATGTSIGAALLTRGAGATLSEKPKVHPPLDMSRAHALQSYAEDWRQACGSQIAAAHSA